MKHTPGPWRIVDMPQEGAPHIAAGTTNDDMTLVAAMILPGMGGYGLSLRGYIALEIIKHCALVTGVVNGEDSAGRSRIEVMAPNDVADRANLIADALVHGWEDAGWVEIFSSDRSAAIYTEQETLKREVSESLWDRTKKGN